MQLEDGMSASRPFDKGKHDIRPNKISAEWLQKVIDHINLFPSERRQVLVPSCPKQRQGLVLHVPQCQRQSRRRHVLVPSCSKQGQGLVLCIPKCQRESQSRQDLVTSFLKRRQSLVLYVPKYMWSRRRHLVIQMRL